MPRENSLALALAPPIEPFPPCLCPTSTPWRSRRLDRSHNAAVETRTCLTCAITITVASCEVSGPDDPDGCGKRAHWTVTPTRYGSREHYVCESHAREALQYTYDRVEDAAGICVKLDDDGEIVPVRSSR